MCKECDNWCRDEKRGCSGCAYKKYEYSSPISRLREYVDVDESYMEFKHCMESGKGLESLSEYDLYCSQICLDIEYVLDQLEFYKKKCDMNKL